MFKFVQAPIHLMNRYIPEVESLEVRKMEEKLHNLQQTMEKTLQDGKVYNS